MRVITYKDLLAATGLNNDHLKVLRQRRQIALAWGRSDAYAPFLYFEIDVFAHALTNALASIFTRSFAASIVRVHFDVWGGLVARTDATGEQVYFGVVEVVRPGKPVPRSHFTLGANTDDPRALANRVMATPQAHGYIPVRAVGANITGLLAEVRANAAKAGLDFSDPFLPAPDHPAYAELFGPYTKARDQAIEQVKALTPKGRERWAQRTGEMARAIAEQQLAERRLLS
jgi:hypothetical protein